MVSLVPRPCIRMEKRPGNLRKFKLLLPLPENQSDFIQIAVTVNRIA